jgi:hypothetical protein
MLHVLIAIDELKARAARRIDVHASCMQLELGAAVLQDERAVHAQFDELGHEHTAGDQIARQLMSAREV